MEKIRFRLYQLTLIFVLISLAMALLNTGKQREFFYFGVYASIIGLSLEVKKIEWRQFSIAYPIILAGLLNLSWYFAYEYHQNGLNFFNNYLDTSKKLVLGGILVFYLDQFKNYVSTQSFQKYLLMASGIGFALASCYAIWQVYQGPVRAEMGINRATVAAYVYSVLSICLIYSLYIRKNVLSYALAALCILLSYVVILFTGTRAAMGLYLIMTLILTLYHFRKIHIKSTVIFICVVAGICALSYKSYIKPKIDQTITEVNDFQGGKDNTSLGARFSMWQVGIQNGLSHPLGQSMESRAAWSKDYVKTHPHLAASMIYINVHLHNEFIEKYSLQGIPGVVVLLFFFVSLLLCAIRRQNALLLTSTLFLLLYGFTDVLLLSSEGTLFFLTVFASSTLLSARKVTE